ncbi:hypothetical protein AACH06_12250 [Ideonella sp. DXS29W]|uniref:Uncharacterized protein n=1 Tax=Ideonella lacteola TaxID=2984193 RepID=A0ABU9BP95_9BURK
MNSDRHLQFPDRRHYELRFTSLFDAGRAYAFECDAQGHVDLDRLSARARLNYLYARSVIGREFSMPEVRRSPRPH